MEQEKQAATSASGEMHRFALESIRASRWKNGGGSTYELACWPRGADLETFDWRVSVAAIDASGPFSIFAGIERTIVLLHGAPLRLRSRDGRIDVQLDPLEPFAFRGDDAIAGELLGAQSRDFNVMTRRGRVHATVQVLRDAATLEPSAAGLLFVAGGAWQASGDPPVLLSAEQGLWWTDRSTRWQLTPQSAESALLAVRIAASSTS